MALSIVNQGLYLQRETTPGIAATDAMRRYLGIRATLGWEVEKEYFRASGYKAVTGESILTELGTADLEVQQDYNAMLPLLAGVFGAPTTTPLTATPTAAYEHVFEIDPRNADEMVAFTAMWGSPERALQSTYFVPHGLNFTISRTELSLGASAILRAPETGIALPTTGVTEVPMIPVRAATYDAYLDTSWTDRGTTKLLKFYNTDIDFGDKLTPDWVVNSELPSFSELLENTDIDYTQSLRVGFDATAEGMIASALEGGLRFVRVAATGPDINGTDNYGIEIDTSVVLNPTDVGENTGSPSVVVNFDGTLQVDPESGSFARVRLVNTLATV